MKRTLLTGTALATAAMLAASPASAEIALSAYMNFGAGFNNTDQIGGGPSRDGHGFSTNTEIHVTNSMKTDDGMKWGWTIQLEGDAADGGVDPDATGGNAGNVDESYMYVEGNFGKFTLGNDDGGADPEIDGLVYNVSGQQGEGNQGIDGSLKQSTTQTENSLSNSGDAAKIVYDSPRVAGVQVKASYSPGTATVTNEWAGSIHYQTELDGVTTQVRLTGVNSGFVANTNGDNKDNERIGYSVGLGLSWEGYRFETGYMRQHDGNYANAGDDDEAFTIGVGYGQGPWSVNVGYGAMEEDNSNDQWEAWSVGARYTLAKGLAVTGAALVAEDTVSTLNGGAAIDYEEYSVTIEMSF